MTLTRPYAPSRLYEHDNSIADLVRRAGQAQAEGIRRGGDISANMWGSLGQIGSNAVSDYARQRQQQDEQRRMDEAAAAKAEADAPRIADEAEKRRLDLEASRKASATAQSEAERKAKRDKLMENPDRQAVFAELDPQSAAEARKMYEEVDDYDIKRNATWAAGLVRGGFSPQSVKAVTADMKSKGMDPAFIEQIATLPPEGLERIALTYLGQSDAPSHIATLTAYQKSKEVPKAPEGFSLSPGQVRFGPDGKPIASVPREPKASGGVDDIPVQVTPETAPFINQPQFKKLPTGSKNQVLKAAELISTAKAYRDFVLANVDEGGTLLSGPVAAKINSMHGNLAFKGAAGYGQGALQAPDREVMEEIFVNPASLDWKSIVKTKIRGGKEGIRQALDQAIRQLDQDLKRVYGLSLTETKDAPLEKGTTVVAPNKIKRGKYEVSW